MLLSDGYTFISKRCRRYGSDVFETRIMLERAICMLGAEAARLFYEGDRMTRKGAVPRPTLKLLQDEGSVELLGGEAHRWRKRVFMSLMTPEGIRKLADMTADHWRARTGKWQGMQQVVLLPEVEEILSRAVCQWPGVPLAEAEAEQRTREFAAMIDGTGFAQ